MLFDLERHTSRQVGSSLSNQHIWSLLVLAACCSAFQSDELSVGTRITRTLICNSAPASFSLAIPRRAPGFSITVSAADASVDVSIGYPLSSHFAAVNRWFTRVAALSNATISRDSRDPLFIPGQESVIIQVSCIDDLEVFHTDFSLFASDVTSTALALVPVDGSVANFTLLGGSATFFVLYLTQSVDVSVTLTTLAGDCNLAVMVELPPCISGYMSQTVDVNLTSCSFLATSFRAESAAICCVDVVRIPRLSRSSPGNLYVMGWNALGQQSSFCALSYKYLPVSNEGFVFPLGVYIIFSIGVPLLTAACVVVYCVFSVCGRKLRARRARIRQAQQIQLAQAELQGAVDAIAVANRIAFGTVPVDSTRSMFELSNPALDYCNTLIFIGRPVSSSCADIVSADILLHPAAAQPLPLSSSEP